MDKQTNRQTDNQTGGPDKWTNVQVDNRTSGQNNKNIKVQTNIQADKHTKETWHSTVVCLSVKNYSDQKNQLDTDCTYFQSGTEMAVNFARIAQDEAKLLDQVQNYPEKMAGLTFDPNISGADQPARSYRGNP